MVDAELIELAKAEALASCKRRGCMCVPDIEIYYEGAAAFSAIRHDDWCPAIHDPADN